MNPPPTGHRDRVNDALAFREPDRTPRDFAAAAEIWQALGKHFGTGDRHDILKRLGVDCRVVSYDAFCRHPDVEPGDTAGEQSEEDVARTAMWRRVMPDGTSRDIWGAHRKKVPATVGVQDAFASFPLAGARSPDDLREHRWPEPDWWDFTGVPEVVARFNDDAVHHIRYRIGSVFETAWSLYGFERFLTDMAGDGACARYIMDRVADVHAANLERILADFGGLIDMVYFFDDVAGQNGPFISPAMFDTFVRPHHQRLIDIAKAYDTPVMLHSCGSVFPLIERFIDMGIDVLNPVQPSAYMMAPELLTRRFGGRIAFHGGIDIQQFLPGASPHEVVRRVERTSAVLGAHGGYIMAPSHHVQADTPPENVLAMYGCAE